MWTVVVGFIVHVVFLMSIFDIYFTTPIVHGVEPQEPPLGLPKAASRLVLFVADGLRADSFYTLDHSGSSPAPYLRSVIKERGAWGVSHTHVPTESRPGHVAIIAGLYEDPSAVARGWKENPVEFDSVFNRSQVTFSWGSPDILPMFAKGTKRMHMDTYSADKEDFGGSEAAFKLDQWVFEHVEAALKRKEMAVLREQERVVFFLHLLGLDTNGHTHRPASREYKENIRLVDQGVRKVEEMMEDFFGHDRRTAYVFTADHGMTDWGSHGAGDPSETETPLVVWGSGVRGPKVQNSSVANSPAKWGLDRIGRSDVEQADIAPLMAALIGSAIPVNSVGRLPVDFLNVSDCQKAELIFTNARQMAAQLERHRQLQEEDSLPFLYWPFLEFEEGEVAKAQKDIQYLIRQGNCHEAVLDSSELISKSLRGIDYYHRYNQNALTASITLAFLGWVAYLGNVLLKDFSTVGNDSLEGGDAGSRSKKTGNIQIHLAFIAFASLVGFCLYIQNSPLQYFMYFLLPVVLWWAAISSRQIFQAALMQLYQKSSKLHIFSICVVYLLGVEILVVSFFYRWALCIGLIGMAVWPYCTSLRHSRLPLCAIWSLCCLILAAFPLFPVVGRESNSSLVGFVGWLVLFCAGLVGRDPQLRLAGRDSKRPREMLRVLVVSALQMAVVPAAIWVSGGAARSLARREEVWLVHQLAAWIILGLSLILPMLGSQWLLLRLLQVAVSLFAPFLLLSLSHEGLFYLSLSSTLGCWLILEHRLSGNYIELQDITFVTSPPVMGPKQQYALSLDDLRRAYFFLFFILLSFFGTGNIASINSFDPTAVRCFLTVFSPFVMGALLLVKIVIPFLLVTCAFRAITVTLKIPVQQVFLLTLVLCDLAGLHFFHLVTNQGSWLDIGTSISHFVIMEVTVLFLCVLFVVARTATAASLWPLAEALWSCRIIRRQPTRRAGKAE